MIKLRFEGHDLADLRRVYDPQIIDKAMITGFNRAITKARTSVKNAAGGKAGIYNVTVGTINKASRIYKRNKPLERWLIYRGHKVGLGLFGGTKRVVRRSGRKYEGAAFKYKRSGKPKIAKGGFLRGKGADRRIYRRAGDSKYPIRVMTGPSVAHMVADDRVVNAGLKRFLKEVDLEFNRAMSLHLSKAKR